MRYLFLPALLGALLLPASALAATSAYQATSTSQLLSGAQAQGRIGDFVLENDHVVIVISALGHVTHYGENGGTVIDVAIQENRLDALGELYTYFDDDWPRQAVYTGLFVLDGGGGGGPAVIRATGHDLNDPGMDVETDYVLGDGDRHLTMTTRINGGGAVVPGFELGDAFAWGSCSRYAPGHGFAVTGTTTQAWMAGLANDVCYAYAGIYGDCWGPNGNGWSDLSVTTGTLDPVLPVAYTRYLAVAPGEIAAAVDILHDALGTPAGTVVANVRSQADGSLLEGALVEVFDGAGGPYVQATVKATGQAVATIPEGDWKVRASLTGYLPGETWVTVYDGATHALDFFLEPTSGGGGEAIGDTITVIQRPLVNIPSMVRPGDTLVIECAADPATTGWTASLAYGPSIIPLGIASAAYDPTTEWWTLEATVPVPALYELYDLRVTAAGGLDDTARDAVRILEAFRDDFYFVHITDAHLPDHRFSSDGAAPEDSTEMVDLREVIADLNVINPEFVLITGDYINEGELEDYMEWRAYTRAQRMLYEFDAPTYLVSGNHDIGGWIPTPSPDGTARRDWWRFFGWPRLDDPPPGAPLRTQNYSFDYGPVHFVGLESYNNYDRWREDIYGSDSFINEQLAWLNADLAGSSSGAQVLFYHKDFQDQINLNALGVEMALWGHVHSDNDDMNGPPFDISTDNVCDGARSYRLIRVSGATLQPEYTVSAGGAGQNLRVAWAPSNGGLSPTVTATVTNAHPLRFENGRLRFVMPAADGHYTATGGTIVQIDESGAFDVCHVAVDIPAGGTAVVIVEPDVSPVPDPAAGRFRLARNHPNPFNPMTAIAYELPARGRARLAVYDLAGREVAVLVDGVREAGPHQVAWNGRDGGGRDLPSGIYLVRLTAGGEAASRKITLAR